MATPVSVFDEIQNLPNWELFINRLQREGYNLVVTGSNLKLLSKELATHLTNRQTPAHNHTTVFV
ncbi:MAG: AAA family ATPase [Nitrososphaerota archaeon]|nr:AAA family ATPase [Nitrososphaerota archaeon]